MSSSDVVFIDLCRVENRKKLRSKYPNLGKGAPMFLTDQRPGVNRAAVLKARLEQAELDAMAPVAPPRTPPPPQRRKYVPTLPRFYVRTPCTRRSSFKRHRCCNGLKRSCVTLPNSKSGRPGCVLWTRSHGALQSVSFSRKTGQVILQSIYFHCQS